MFLFEQDFDSWYLRYVAGISEKGTPAMDKGAKIHGILQDGKLPKKGLDKGEVRVYGAMLKAFDAELKLLGGRKATKWEHMATQPIDGIPTIGFWDGLAPRGIIEIKTGSALWTQDRADNHGQLAFYALQHGGNPDFWLFSASTSNGKCKMFHVKHTAVQLDAMRERIDAAWKAMAKYHDLRTKTLAEL